MGLTVKCLANGTISSVSSSFPSVLYPNPTPSTAIGTLIKSIALSNVTSATIKIALKIRPGSVSAGDRYIAPVNLTLGPFGAMILDATFSLTAGPTPDQIVASLDGNTNGIAYLISGVERDQ